MRSLIIVVTVAITLAAGAQPAEDAIRSTVDPVKRYVHVEYRMPAYVPDVVTVACVWSRPGEDAWHTAKVMPLISETGYRLASAEAWKDWLVDGCVTERRAAGLTRTVVFDPYPEAQVDGVLDVDFRLEIQDTDGQVLDTQIVRVQADNSDVVYIEDWSQVFQSHGVVEGDAAGAAKWGWRTDLPESACASGSSALIGDAGPDTPLPQLSYPLDLRGHYAVFVCTTVTSGGIRLRLTGDERTDPLASAHAREEVFWRWTRMDNQHLVLRQPHQYTGYAPGSIDYVKFVPLSDEQVARLDGQFGVPDKLVAGYWEPYSWAFSENVQETLQHREPLSAFAEARIGIVDTQIGRFGMKVVYESRETDPLFYSTQGDPIGHVARPTTDNVGRMQQYTNTLDATLRYTREFGTVAHANFGATNCYPGSPLQGDFSKKHPEWMRGSALRYEVPEVREYVFTLYREALEIGAPGISIDFCRYPAAVDSRETCTAFMRGLRGLADEFGARRGERVPILVRFPGTGVRQWEHFDYATWVREGLVDYLCPSNIQGRHLHIDISPYQEAVKGTNCTLLPALDGLSWGQPMPGPFLWRVHQLYEAGAKGIYVYQADARVLGHPTYRRCMRMVASSEAVRDWWTREAELCPTRSKCVRITPACQVEGWHGWQRLRAWPEGVPLGEVEFYLDGAFVNRCGGPPYLLGTEDTASDGVIPPGEHEVRIRARDEDGWLEQTFTIIGAS